MFVKESCASSKEFNNVSVGELFFYEGAYYIKVIESMLLSKTIVNAVDLGDGSFSTFNDSDKVDFVELIHCSNKPIVDFEKCEHCD